MIACLAYPSNGVCQSGGLAVQTELAGSKYCIDQAGTLDLRVSVRFTYHNHGQHAVLLPQFDQVAESSLFPDEASALANRPENQEKYRLTHFFDPAKLAHSRRPILFDIVEVGRVQVRIHEIRIRLRPPRRPGVSLLGGDHYLRIEINHWPEKRHLGEDLVRRWREFGVLLIDNIVTPMIKLHIERDPTGERCQDRID